MGRNQRRLPWTQIFRRINKKDVTDDVRRRRRVVAKKMVRSFLGVSADTLAQAKTRAATTKIDAKARAEARVQRQAARKAARKNMKQNLAANVTSTSQRRGGAGRTGARY